MSLEAIGHHALITAGIHAVERLRHARFIACRIINPTRDLRISLSAILSIRDGDRYVLVRNLHRPEVFGPLGGVCKYDDNAKTESELRALGFRDEGNQPHHDTKTDLRGFIIRRSLPRLVEWYDSPHKRENGPECLRRELREELVRERRVGVTIPKKIAFELVRRVYEGPLTVPGESYDQFRIFDVYSIAPEYAGFCARLVRVAETHEDLALATSAEIKRGRNGDNRLIANHAAYLVGGKRMREDLPHYVRVAKSA